MTTTARERFDTLVDEFCDHQSLSELDQAIVDHVIDGWPMGNLAKQYGMTLTVLHRRKRALMSQFHDHLVNHGIRCSWDIFP
ncbi:MAG: hypothetical protein LLG20_23910 [Acidobacteriales bacterium]|nr:hypothetical protein [Terriglobales bacterium]